MPRKRKPEDFKAHRASRTDADVKRMDTRRQGRDVAEFERRPPRPPAILVLLDDLTPPAPSEFGEGEEDDGPDMLEPEPREHTVAPLAQREWTRDPVDTSGSAQFMIMIRAPGDPERRTREDRHKAMGVTAAASEWKKLRRATVATWCERFRELLADDVPRTLNAMAVVLVDQTADIVGDSAIAALWALKADGVVEHTVDAPVLWRLVTP